MSLSIRPVLLAEAAIGGPAALLMLIGASPLADLLDLPAGLLAGAGAALVSYVAFLLWLSRRDHSPRPAVTFAIGVNIAWAIGCVALLVSRWVEPNALGTAFVLIQVATDLLFAGLKELALKWVTADRHNSPRMLEV